MVMENFQDAVMVEGDGEAKAKVTEYLNQLKKSVELEGDVPLELHEVGQGSSGAIYATEWNVTEGTREVVDEIVEAAVEDAMQVGRGTVRFKVIVEKMPKAGRVAFTLKVPKNDEFSSDDLEEIDELATHKGVLSQLMRHQEKVMKVGLGGASKNQDSLLRQLESAQKRITELEERHMENTKVYEELLSGRHARDLELRKLDNEEKRKEQIGGMLMNVAPMLIGKLMAGKSATGATEPAALGAAPSAQGSSAAGVPPDSLAHMVEQLLSSFDGPQLTNLMQSGLLHPPQMMLLVEIAKEVQARIHAREAATKNGYTDVHAASQSQHVNGHAPTSGTGVPQSVRGTQDPNEVQPAFGGQKS